MKKLYRVEAFVYVMAKDEDEACLIAINNFDSVDCEAKLAESVDHTWYDSMPHGSDSDMTCGEIVIDQAKQIKAERLQNR